MTKVSLLLAATVMLAPAVGIGADQYVVAPGLVVQEPKSQLISGSVTLKKSPLGKDGTTGGGCLAYTPVASPTPCTSNSDCDAVGGGYCAPFTSNRAQGTKVCWRQPDQTSCHKSPVPLEAGKPYPFDNLTNPYPVGVKRPIKWRVVSCQNLSPMACKNGPPENKVLRFGPIREFN